MNLQLQADSKKLLSCLQILTFLRRITHYSAKDVINNSNNNK